MKHGIELEFSAAIMHAYHQKYGGFYDYVLNLIQESGVHNWKCEADASCGNEIVSPILEGEKGLRSALQVCHCVYKAQQTFKLGRVLGPDASVHFHFDATDLVKDSKSQSHKNTRDISVQAIRNVLLLSAILEPLWFSMNPGSRFETAFAAPLNFNLFQMFRARDMVDIRDIWFRHYMGVKGHSDSYRIEHNSYSPTFVNGERKPDKYDWTRYHGMNLNALWKHGTFEFRYTGGSFNPDNIEMWFRLYKDVVDLARSSKTRSIIRACPMNIEDVKSSSIGGLQTIIYGDLNIAIRFMFLPLSKTALPLFGRDANMLRFILKKIIKYNPTCLPAKIMKSIWNDDGTDFERLMGYIAGIRISSIHRRRNRYKYTPESTNVTNGAMDTPPDQIGLDNLYVDEDAEEEY